MLYNLENRILYVGPRVVGKKRYQSHKLFTSIVTYLHDALQVLLCLPASKIVNITITLEHINWTVTAENRSLKYSNWTDLLETEI